MQSRLLIFFVAFLSVVFFSCATPKALEYHDYKNFSIQNVGLMTSTVKMDLVYYNPNGFGLQLKSTDLDVYVDSIFVGHATQEYQVTIPRKAEFTIPVNLEVDTKNLLQNALVTAFNQEIDLKVTGTAKVGKMNAYINFPVNYEGKQAFKLF